MLKNKRANNFFFAVFVACIVLFIFFLNQLTQLIIDDYYYTYGTNGNKITTVQEIFEFELQNYAGHTGRVVLHTFAQFFLLSGKSLFNIVNTAVYLALSFLIYRIIWVERPAPFVYLAVCWGMWLFIPVFGQTCLWLVGA